MCHATLHIYVAFKRRIQHPSSRRASELSSIRTHFHARMCKTHTEMVTCPRYRFWNVRQRELGSYLPKFRYNISETTLRQTVLTLADGKIIYPEPSLNKYRPTLCHIPEERRSRLESSGILNLV